MSSENLFLPEEGVTNLRVSERNETLIQHEVFYEEDLNTIKNRPLFVGRAFGKRRFIAFAFVGCSLFSLLIGRAAWMQIAKGEEYVALAEANRLRSTPIWPGRGIVRDREGNILAENMSRFQVLLTPRELSADIGKREIELGTAARLLGLSLHELESFAYATGTARDEETVVAGNIPYPQAMGMAIALPDLPGFDLEIRPKRRYPYSAQVQSLSHVLGYVGKLSREEYLTERKNGYRSSDEMGKNGIEKTYEKALRGIVGRRVSEVDAHGSVKGMVGDTPAIDGQDLWLSLDVVLQQKAEEALQKEMRAAQVKRGAAVVMDPRDGAILALVSLPAYDDNAFSGGVSSTVYQSLIQNPDQPLYPRAWAGSYPSGSTVKIVISVAALAEKVVTANTTVLSTGGIRIGQWFFPDWKAGGHGATNVRRAIAWSVNTFYYTVGGGYGNIAGLGVDRLTDWMRRFGLGVKSGIDLPAENTGHVPSREWKEKTKGEKWFVGDTYNLSIGQGDLLVTPLQVAVYTSAIANGGKLVTPHVVNAQGEKEAKMTWKPRNEQLADASVISVVQDGMRDGVIYGSSRGMSVLPFAVSGKTGTAQWSSKNNTHAWFTSYAPSAAPEVVVTVLLEEGGEGSSVSVPVAREIMQAWWDLRNKRGGKF